MDDFDERNRKIVIFNWRTRKMKKRNVVLMLMLMCTVLSSPLFAGVLPGANGGRDFVEALVPGGVYLDFVANGVGYTNGGFTVTTNATDWGWPDDSDDDHHVDGDSNGDGDSYDSKSHTASDFIATISGLDSGVSYGIYLLAFQDGDGYGYKWGLTSASDNVIDPALQDADNAIIVSSPVGEKGTCLWLLREETFPASGAGEIVLHFGQAGGRTHHDGVLLLDERVNPSPVVNAGPDQAVYDPEGLPVQLAGTASDDGPLDGTSPGSPGGVVSSYWFQQSGPEGGVATFHPADTNLVYDPNVTFNITGAYELVLQASDGLLDSNDIVVITVKDHADDFLLGHWEMENNLLDTTTNNDGTALTQVGFDTDSAVGTYALSLYNPDYDEPNYAVHLGPAPELDIQTVPPEFTVSAWVKTTYSGSDEAVIISKGGDDGGGIRWVLGASEGRLRLTTDDNSSKLEPRGGIGIVDGLWHHVVGTCDGQRIRLYVDGVFDGDQGVPEGYDLSGSSQKHGYIGANTSMEHQTDPCEIQKPFDGLIDDVRVYNYALPLDDPTYPSILKLSAMGPIVASVYITENDGEFPWKPGRLKDLTGVVTDPGANPETNTVLWTTESGPGAALFTDADEPITTVGFPAAGVYVLKLTVTDPDAPGVDISDVIEVTAISPTCAEALADGHGLTSDVSGPDGEPDCHVDLFDVAAIAADWLKCMDPQDPDCDDPYE